MIFTHVPSTLLPFGCGQNRVESKSGVLPATTGVPVAHLNNKVSSHPPLLSALPERTHLSSRGAPPPIGVVSRQQRVSLSGPVGSSKSRGYLSGFCVHTCICRRIRCVKVLKHWPHFQRCQSLNSECSWLVEVGLASTRWFFTLIWLNPDSMDPDLSRREKFLLHGVCGKTTERCWAAGGSLPLLLKGCRASCLHMASMTVEGTFTGRTARGGEDEFWGLSNKHSNTHFKKFLYIKI